MDDYRAGLRCQDVNSGLRTFDAASPSLTPLKKTRLVGMAADLAGLVRGTHLISDMASLETVAAAELDIPPTSFDGVIDLLDAAGLVELTRDAHGDIAGLTSEVPYYQDLYVTLGATWRTRHPSQLEEEMVAVVDQLAAGPFRLSCSSIGSASSRRMSNEFFSWARIRISSNRRRGSMARSCTRRSRPSRILGC